MTKIAIVGFDKFTDIDLFMPWDLLNRAKSAGAKDSGNPDLGQDRSHNFRRGIENSDLRPP